MNYTCALPTSFYPLCINPLAIASSVNFGTNWAKLHRRRQFTFYPKTLKDIEAFAEELGVAEAEMARWCIERGLKALHDGERPRTVSVEKVTLVRPTQLP